MAAFNDRPKSGDSFSFDKEQWSKRFIQSDRMKQAINDFKRKKNNKRFNEQELVRHLEQILDREYSEYVKRVKARDLQQSLAGNASNTYINH